MTINLFPKKEEKRAPKNKPKISRESKGSAVESSKSAALQVRSMVRVSWTVGFKLSGRRDCDEVAADPGPSIIHALGGGQSSIQNWEGGERCVGKRRFLNTQRTKQTQWRLGVKQGVVVVG